MSFIYTEQLNILGKSRSSVGNLGAKIVKGLSSGKEMKCEQLKLSYIGHIVDMLCRFVPVGEVDDNGHVRVLADNNITQEDADKFLNKLISLCPEICTM